MDTEEQIQKYKLLVYCINKHQDFLFDKIKNKEDLNDELDKMILAEKINEVTKKNKEDTVKLVFKI